MSAMCESPSGASRTVAAPRTMTLQPAGATNVFPQTVVLGVSAASFSTLAEGAAGFSAGGGAAADGMADADAMAAQAAVAITKRDGARMGATSFSDIPP